MFAIPRSGLLNQNLLYFLCFPPPEGGYNLHFSNITRRDSLGSFSFSHRATGVTERHRVFVNHFSENTEKPDGLRRTQSVQPFACLWDTTYSPSHAYGKNWISIGQALGLSLCGLLTSPEVSVVLKRMDAL